MKITIQKNVCKKPHIDFAIVVKDPKGKHSTEKEVCKYCCLMHFLPNVVRNTCPLSPLQGNVHPSGSCCEYNCRLLYSRSARYRLSATAPKIILTTTNSKRFAQNQQRLSFNVFAPQNYMTYGFMSISTFNYFPLEKFFPLTLNCI